MASTEVIVKFLRGGHTPRKAMVPTCLTINEAMAKADVLVNDGEDIVFASEVIENRGKSLDELGDWEEDDVLTFTFAKKSTYGG